MGDVDHGNNALDAFFLQIPSNYFVWRIYSLVISDKKVPAWGLQRWATHDVIKKVARCSFAVWFWCVLLFVAAIASSSRHHWKCCERSLGWFWSQRIDFRPPMTFDPRWRKTAEFLELTYAAKLNHQVETNFMKWINKTSCLRNLKLKILCACNVAFNNSSQFVNRNGNVLPYLLSVN